MTNALQIAAVLSLGVILLSGCTSAMSFSLTKDRFAPTDINSISILEAEPSRPYVAIARLTGTTSTLNRTDDTSKAKIMQRAAARGAHAVIMPASTTSYGGELNSVRTIYATAIRWKDPQPETGSAQIRKNRS